jgi:hypothetical protein
MVKEKERASIEGRENAHPQMRCNKKEIVKTLEREKDG